MQLKVKHFVLEKLPAALYFLDKQMLKINQKVKLSPQASNKYIGLLYPLQLLIHDA